MTKLIRVLAFAAIAGLLACAPARAQMNAASTYVTTSGGTNAITVTLPNVTALSDLRGVPIRVKVAGSNTTAATLQVNALTATAINKPTTAGLAALNGGEIVAGQINVFIYDGTVFELQSPNLFLGTVPTQNGFTTAVNLQINCTAAANALTCAMKSAQTGGDPSALSPVYVPFRDTTTANGDPVWRTITAAVSFTISGGNTMGCVSAAPCRLWITAIDNAGTVVLGLSNQLATAATTLQVFPLNEGTLQTTGSGTGGGNTAGTIFTSVSALSSKAVRIIGYVEWTSLTTAGNWTTPNFVQLFGPGVARPGASVQATAKTSASGDLSLPITPTSAANLVRVSTTLGLGVASGALGTTLVKRGSTTILTLQLGTGSVATTLTGVVTGIVLDNPASTSPTTYTTTTTGTGGTPSTGAIVIEEIMGANDNMLEPLAKVG